MESSASSLAPAQRPPPTSSGSFNGLQRPTHQLGAAQQVRAIGLAVGLRCHRCHGRQSPLPQARVLSQHHACCQRQLADVRASGHCRLALTKSARLEPLSPLPALQSPLRRPWGAHKEQLWSASIATSLTTSLLSLAAAAAALALGGPLAAPSMAAVAAQDLAAAEQSFQKSCVGCHAGGGNILQSGANLTLSDLERNGVNSEDSIYSLIYSGRGRMPGYGEACAPRGQCTFGPRLSDDEIRALAAFVLQSAAAGWSEAAAP
eukprot:SM000077S21584  [mRNA]  locus=s77:289994:291954:- [translate_table: standard]